MQGRFPVVYRDNIIGHGQGIGLTAKTSGILESRDRLIYTMASRATSDPVEPTVREERICLFETQLNGA